MPVKHCARIHRVIAAGAAALLAAPAAAGVKEVRMGVKGVVCATCAFTLRKAFGRLPDVDQSKLLTRPARMEVRPKAGQWPDLDRMRDTIKNAGFVPVADRVELVVTGTLLKQADGVDIALDGMQSPVSLPVRVEADASVRASDLEKRVGEVVELEGRWEAPPRGGEGAGTLLVASMRPAASDARK